MTERVHCDTWFDVFDAVQRGQPWRIGLVFFGRTKLGNVSQKYWLVEGRSLTAHVRVSYGRCGTRGQSKQASFDDAQSRYSKKRGKGYQPAGPEFLDGDKATQATALLGSFDV